MLEARSTLLARRLGGVATALVVGAGLALAGASPAAADETAHIMGIVTNAGDEGLGDIEVSVYLYDVENEFWDAVDHTYTNEFGEYDVTSLPAGNYRVGFFDETFTYVEEFWNDALSIEAAASVEVTNGATVAKDAVLATYSHITGRVTDPNGDGELDVRVMIATARRCSWWSRLGPHALNERVLRPRRQ